MARSCIFCGESHVTREHIWPRWAQKYLLARHPERYTRGIEAAGRDSVRQVYLERPYDATARVVCKGCNEGWMSRLEQQAQPLLVKLTSGTRTHLSRTDQQLLAAWGFKTALVLDASFRHRTGVANEHRRYLARTGAPPPTGVLIWVATYDGARPGQFRENGMALGGPGVQLEDTDEPNLWVATLTFGSLVFHVAGCADRHIFRAEGITYGDLRLRRIWPYQAAFEWRSTPAFSDAEIPVLATTLYERLLDHVGSVTPASAALRQRG